MSLDGSGFQAGPQPVAARRLDALPGVQRLQHFPTVAGNGLTKNKRSGVRTFLALVDCESGPVAL
jgi:hypothetical protein